MKTFLTRYGLLSALILLFIGVFAVGGIFSRYMTEQIAIRSELREHENQNAADLAVISQMFDGDIDITAFTPASVTKTYLLANGSDYSPTIEKAFRVQSGSQEIGVVYYVVSHGRQPNLRLAFGFDTVNDIAKGVVVLSQDETPFYYALLNDAFYAQFDGAALSDVGFGVDGVAGATYSSTGFALAWLYAREVYAVDFDFTIPTVTLTLVDLHYNFDPATFVASPFIADILYGEGDVSASVYLSPAFEYVGIVGGGSDLSADEQAYLKSLASQDGSVSATAHFISYDSGTRVLIMGVKGFANEPITVTMTLNVALDGIETYSVVSEQSYDDEYNMDDYGNYEGGPVPAVENYFMNQYQTTGVVPIDSVAGASQGTSPAMRTLIGLLDLFLNDLNGGE